MIIPSLTGGAGGTAGASLDAADSISNSSAGMGDWTVAVGGSGANSGAATSTPAASNNSRLIIVCIAAVAALYLLR